MRVGLYCGSLHKEGSGIQVYVRELLNCIIQLYPDVDVTLIYNISRCTLKKSDYRTLITKIKVQPFYIPEKFAIKLWRRVDFPYIDGANQRFDVVHSTTSYLPPVKYAKKIVTVHDLACVTYPDKLIISGARAKYSIDSIKNADLIITDSESTRRDVVSMLNIREEKVITVYLGIDPVFLSPREPYERKLVMERYSIDYPYFLFVGNIDPRKNLRRLVTAYGKFVEKHKQRERLILIGKKTSQADSELSIIEQLGLQNKVTYLGYVPRCDLLALYANARIFVFPSLFEGFGFPVLEAMACGVPVITSNISSLPEVTGDAAYYVTPDSVTSITRALEEVSSNSRLRNVMIKKGLKRAGQFRWERTASRTMDCYDMIHKGH